MTKNIICLILSLSIVENTCGQDFIAFEVVEIVNKNLEEVIFYYESNWAQLRKVAKQLGFIANFAWYHSSED